MLERVLRLFSGRKNLGSDRWDAGPVDLVKATRAVLRDHNVYSQFTVDKAEHAYLQALEDGRSDERVAFLKEEFEHRKARGKGYVVWTHDGYMTYPTAA